MEDCMVFTLAGSIITANCKWQSSKQFISFLSTNWIFWSAIDNYSPFYFLDDRLIIKIINKFPELQHYSVNVTFTSEYFSLFFSLTTPKLRCKMLCFDSVYLGTWLPVNIWGSSRQTVPGAWWGFRFWSSFLGQDPSAEVRALKMALCLMHQM